MNSNTHSTRRSAGHPTSRSTGRSDPLAALASAVDQLAAQNLDGLPDAVAAEQVLALRRLLDRLEGHWLKEPATVDARGAAGAEDGIQAPSTAGWLRNRLRMGATAATSQVRTARALFRGPLTQTGQAVIDGAIAPAHASVLTHGTHEPPRPHRRQGRTGAAGGRPTPRPAPAAASGRPPPAGRRPRGRRGPGRTPAAAAGPVACCHPGRHGRHRRPPGPRSRSDVAGGPGPADPPPQRPGRAQRGPAPR